MGRTILILTMAAALGAAAACAPIDPNAANANANRDPFGKNASDVASGNANANVPGSNANSNANSNAAGSMAAPGQATKVGTQLPHVFTRPQAVAGEVNYLLYLPADYDAAAGKRWPLIMYLHGKSFTGDDVERLKHYALPHRLEKNGVPFIVVSPQARAGQRWTDLDTLVALLDDIERTYPIDLSRVYLTGYSMGGGGAWRLAAAHPDRFAAVAPLAGSGDVSQGKNLARVPIWAIHGTADEATPVDESRKMVAATVAAGGDAKLTELPGRPHDIGDFYDGPELFEWFLAHTR